MRAGFPVAASPVAWPALADPEVLAAALPGCRSARPIGDAPGVQVVVEVAVASVRGLWAGTVVPIDAHAVRIAGSGEPGTVDVVVRADPERTALTVDGTVEGPLAAVGSALLAAAARRLADDLLSAAATPGRNRWR